MKFLGILCLLCTVTWTFDVVNANQKPIFQFFTYQNKKYGLSVYSKVNWFEAQQICASVGFRLVSIPSQVIQNQIYSFMTSAVGSQLGLLADEPFWTSGTNQGSTSQYIWQSSGAPVTYRNFQSPPATGYRCIAFNGSNGVWTALDCRTKQYFICEGKPSTC